MLQGIRGHQNTPGQSGSHSLAGRSSDTPVLPAPGWDGRDGHPSAASSTLGWQGWTSPSLSVAFWEDWHYTDRMWSVPEGEGSWLKAERMENVRCCFCLALGTDPAEIITEEFTLPCQICRYFAVLRFDVLFL